MVLHICEKCRVEFNNLDLAKAHEDIPIFGEEYNCHAAKTYDGKKLVFFGF